MADTKQFKFLGKEGLDTLLDKVNKHTQHVRKDAPLVKGDGNNSAKSDISGVTVTSAHSIAHGKDLTVAGDGSAAFGQGNMAGTKGYYIASYATGTDSVSPALIVLPDESTSPYTGNTTKPGWHDGAYSSDIEYDVSYNLGTTINNDYIYVVNGSHFVWCAQVVDTDGNAILLSNKLPFEAWETVSKSDRTAEDYTVCFPEQPQVGAASYRICAFAAGDTNKASGHASVTLGRDNLALSNYSFVAGRDNIVGYAGTAFGRRNTAMGNYSIAGGIRAVATGASSIAFGRSTAGGNAKNNFKEKYRPNVDNIEQLKEYQDNEGLLMATGVASVAIGTNTLATADNATALGEKTFANGKSAFVTGTLNAVEADNSAIIGGQHNGVAAKHSAIVAGGGSGNRIYTCKISQLNYTVETMPIKYIIRDGVKETLTTNDYTFTHSAGSSIILFTYEPSEDAITNVWNEVKNSFSIVLANTIATTFFNNGNSITIDNKELTASDFLSIGAFGGLSGTSSSVCFLGGHSNTITEVDGSVIAGGFGNQMTKIDDNQRYLGGNFIGGGSGNFIEKYAGCAAFGVNNHIRGKQGFAAGVGLECTTAQQAVFGKYNTDDGYTAFIVGRGDTDTNRANIFAVDKYGGVYGGTGITRTTLKVTAYSKSQTIFGAYNAYTGLSDAKFIVGNGSSDSSRSNALVVYNNGRVEGGKSTISSDTTLTLTTKDYVDNHVHTVTVPTSASFNPSVVTSTGASATTTINNVTNVGTTPSLTATVTNKCLTFSWSAGSAPTTTAVTVAANNHTHNVTTAGSVSLSSTSRTTSKFKATT